eukprot:1909639-Ditylum_brightwellii.AAC.1
MMENKSKVSAALGGGNHGHLVLVVLLAMYQTTAEKTFPPPINPGLVLVSTRQFMMNAEIDLLKETHQRQ